VRSLKPNFPTRTDTPEVERTRAVRLLCVQAGGILYKLPLGILASFVAVDGRDVTVALQLPDLGDLVFRVEGADRAQGPWSLSAVRRTKDFDVVENLPMAISTIPALTVGWIVAAIIESSVSYLQASGAKIG